MARVERNTDLKRKSEALTLLEERLADLLTFSRLIIGLVILYLSIIGPEAYTAVIVLALIGAATDILDGMAARRYLGSGREGRLGKYDIVIDTIFIFCIIAYLSFSGIVIPRAVGLGWIGLATVAAILYKDKQKILTLIEIPSVMAILAAAGLYDLRSFIAIVVPAFIFGLIINRRRVLYLIFKKWPRMFFGK